MSTLPEIIVCGDQSVGKSSALEAICLPDIGAVVEKAKGMMGLSDTKVFSTDTLRVELCGPTQAHLTMVDLPGLFRAGKKGAATRKLLALC